MKGVTCDFSTDLGWHFNATMDAADEAMQIFVAEAVDSLLAAMNTKDSEQARQQYAHAVEWSCYPKAFADQLAVAARMLPPHDVARTTPKACRRPSSFFCYPLIPFSKG